MMVTEGGVTRVLRRYEFVIAAVGVIVLIVRLAGGGFIAHVTDAAKGVTSAATAGVEAPFDTGGGGRAEGPASAAGVPETATSLSLSLPPAAALPRSGRLVARQAAKATGAVTTTVAPAAAAATGAFADGGSLGERSV